LTQFEALGLSPVLLKSVQALGFETPTPIQREAIPLVLRGQDLMGLAQTGTGKTAAYGLPLIHQLLADNIKPGPKSVRALILAPTRELVNQIASNLRDYVQRTPMRINLVIGGASINAQIKNLQRGTDILVATPGRLIDLVERRAVFLDTAKFLVLDEADQMLDLGFIHTLRRIAKLVGTPRQTLLFSATMPKQIEELSRAYQTDPVRVEITPPGQTVDKVRQSVHFTGQRNKVELLRECLAARPGDLSLVFARTKHGAEKLMKTLVQSGFAAGSIHGNKSQGQRERSIKAFRDGAIRVLVATDVAARGIDIPGVSHVYNFDLPEVPENYIHRIGRTARAGAGGEAVAFCGPADIRLLRDIERLMGSKIIVASGEPSEYASAKQGRGKAPPRGGRDWNRGKQQQRGGGGGRNDDVAAFVATLPTGGQKNRHPRYGDAPDTRDAANAGSGAPKHTRPAKWRGPKRNSAAA
jgi:ATP-dependent RNA helicase RhlE